jgi:hypothetical protein
MLISKEIEVNLTSANINHYERLGYEIPRKLNGHKKYNVPKNTKIIVKVEDLPKGSHVQIEYKCDICGKIVPCMYKTYLQMKKDSYTNMDTCNNCKYEKIKISCIDKYGVNNYLELKEVREKSYDKNRHSYDYVYNEFKEADCELLTKYYINNKQVLEYICNKHKDKGVQITNYANFHKYGSSCKYCKSKKISEAKKNDFNIIRQEYDELGYNLLSNEDDYVDCHTGLKCSCKKHKEEIFFVSLVHARRNQGCPKCLIEKISGENHWNWKGGISGLSSYLRDKIKQWIFESLKENDFKCYLTGINDRTLIVHHEYGFNLMIKDVLKELKLPIYKIMNEYSDEELEQIEKLTIDKHYKMGYGKPMVSVLHDIFHQEYGIGNNTPKQFKEFEIRLKQGEFNNFLEENNLKLVI